MRKTLKSKVLKDIHKRLYGYYGPQGWWPGRTRFEVIVGAILTQNTAWTNVEKAISALRRAKLLSPIRMKEASTATLAALIKPAGYFNVKTKRLKNFVNFLFERYGGSLAKASNRPSDILRHELLAVNGIGPETCDSILLYAFKKPVFVVDAYTKRIFSRHAIVERGAVYQEIQKLFMDNLRSGERLYNEYHALIVRVGKDFCRAKARCDRCPLNYLQIYF